MTDRRKMTIACAVAVFSTGSGLLAAEAPLAPVIEAPAPAATPKQRSRPTTHAVIQMPAPELPTSMAISNAGFGTKSAFAAPSIPSLDSTTLSPPITITYSGGSTVLQINNSGTNKGVLSQITNSHNAGSALYGMTNGSGAGLTGYNAGTVGPGGKFGVTNANSSQPGAFTTTNGSGPALLGTVTNSTSNEPALLGENNVSSGYGIGVEGQGNYLGIEGIGGYYGMYATGTDYGAWGYSSSGDGVYGESSSGAGVYGSSYSSDGGYFYSSSGYGAYGYSSSNYGVYAATYSGGAALYANNSTSGRGIIAHSASGIGVYSSSDTGYGIWGQSANSYGVVGEDSGTGYGVYGYSASGYAGYFAGKVGATSYVTLSDRNTKTKIHSIDGKAILDKVTNLPVSSWVFKADPEKNHVGPMAQDFHAAFGLDGDDDKHINLTDIAGVSLASIQELSKEMKQKNAEIAALKQQLLVQTRAMAQMKAMTETVSARMTALEQQQQRSGVATQSVSLKREAGTTGE